MEAGWVQESFQKNDMKIDRAFKKYLEEANKSIPNVWETPLDVYKKDLGDNKSLFRIILALGDEKNKKVQVGDGTVKADGLDFSFVSQELAELKTDVPADKVAFFEQKYGQGATVEAVVFKNPIKEQFFLVKAGGKTNVAKINQAGNGVDKIFTYKF